MNSLKNKFLVIDHGDQYIIGQVAEVNGDYILIRIQVRSDCPTDFYHVYHIGELSCECRECINTYFFDNETQMKKWLAWIDNPGEKIIPFDRNKKE